VSKKQEKAQRIAALQHARKIAANQGTIKVSFCFDGKEFVQTHKLSEAEVALQKQYLESDGLEAFSTVTLRMAIWGAGKLGEHSITEAFKEYARKTYKGPVQKNELVVIDDIQEDTRDDNSAAGQQQVADDNGESVHNG
jgi:hypothetical protein